MFQEEDYDDVASSIQLSGPIMNGPDSHYNLLGSTDIRKSHITIYNVANNKLMDVQEGDTIQHNPDNSNTVRYMKMFGGYLKTKQCPYTIFLIFVLYHILNIIFVALLINDSTLDEEVFCDQFKAVLIAIQIISLLLYLVGFWSLNFNKSKNKRKTNINKILQSKYKAAPWIFVKFFIYGFMGTTDVFEEKHGYQYYVQIIVYVCDIFKWMQAVMLVLIIYGFLNTFPDRFLLSIYRLVNEYYVTYY